MLLSACSKDDDQPVKTIEDITGTEVKMNTPLAPKTTLSTHIWSVLIEKNIYYSNNSNGPGGSQNQFMMRYNIESNSFEEVQKDDEICACGYSNKLITNGRGINARIYYIANEAKRYSLLSNIWINIDYPFSAQENNGETGMVYHQDRIYVLGGRTPSKRFKYYDTSSNSWFNATDYSQNVGSSQLVSANNKIYALGGNNNYPFSIFDSSTNLWTNLPNLPFQFLPSVTNHIVANYNDKYLLVLQNTKLYIYDLLNNKWKTTPLDLNLNSANNGKSIFTSDNDIYITGLSNTNGDFALYKITLNNLP